MTPLRAKVYAWLFVGLAGCATVNVMLFQQRLPLRGIGGVYGDSSAGGAASRLHVPPVSARSAKPGGLAQQVPAAPYDEIVQAVQRELAGANRFAGVIDGRPSRALTAAIYAYEHEFGLEVTGVASDGLLKRLILGPTLASSQGHAPGEIVKGSPADELVRWTVEQLNRLGFDAGRPQSRFDFKAIQALRKFELAEGLPATGRIGEGVIRQLERRTGR